MGGVDDKVMMMCVGALPLGALRANRRMYVCLGSFLGFVRLRGIRRMRDNLVILYSLTTLYSGSQPFISAVSRHYTLQLQCPKTTAVQLWVTAVRYSCIHQARLLLAAEIHLSRCLHNPMLC